MTLHLHLAALNLPDWVGPAVIAFIFFVLPAIRAARESREKQKQMAEKQAQSGGEPPTDAETAPRTWADLMRGEESEAAPWAPPVARGAEASQRPAEPPAPPLVSPRSTYEPESRAEGDRAPVPALAGRLSSLDAAPSEEEQEQSYDEERTARMENDARLREEMQRRAEFLRVEREGATQRTDVASTIQGSAAAVIAESADIARRRDVFGPGLNAGLGTRAGLRRAILASEVLGRPVALRDGSEGTGPLAARQ